MFYVLKAFQEIVQLERYEDSKWEIEKCIYNPEEIIYETKQFDDPVLIEKVKQYNVDQIIWYRKSFYNTKFPVSIKVDYNPQDFSGMRRQADTLVYQRILKEKEEMQEIWIIRNKRNQNPESDYNEKLNAEKEKHAANDKLIPEDISDYEALKLWYDLDMVMPPPKRIKMFKDKMNWSWSLVRRYAERLPPTEEEFVQNLF